MRHYEEAHKLVCEATPNTLVHHFLQVIGLAYVTQPLRRVGQLELERVLRDNDTKAIPDVPFGFAAADA